MKYCRITTENHPVSLTYSDCIEDINALLVKEGHITPPLTFTNAEVVLNLDCVEARLALIQGNKDKNKSMDLTFGIANNDRSIQLMVLVELKLNNSNPNNVRRDHLAEKVAGSFLSLTKVIPIYANYIFIFQIDRKEEAKSRFFRMNPKIPNEYLVMDTLELKTTFF